jgi:uncharacterized protein YjbI with pentapeptide repeats
MKTYLKILIASWVILMLAGLWLMLDNFINHPASNNPAAYTAEQINADNSLINGKTLSNLDFTGLRLENITLKNTTFSNMVISDSDFTDVIFANCVFSRVQIERSRFNGVIFKDGIMTYSTEPADSAREIPTIIRSSTVHNLVFDNVWMRKAYLSGLSGSNLSFRNMRDFNDYSREPAITHGNHKINFRIDNCDIAGQPLATLAGESTIYITNSTLSYSGFNDSRCKIIYVENCILRDTDLASPGLLVVRDSTVQAQSQQPDKVYFVNNEYIPRTRLSGREIHIWGGNKQAALDIGGALIMKDGDIYIYDLELLQPAFGIRMLGQSEFFNLRNVKIRGGHWTGFELNRGIWENVEIYPAIKIGYPPPKIRGLQVHNLTFPQGNPFTSESGLALEVNLQAQEFDQPFAWPEIRVPSARELGLSE